MRFVGYIMGGLFLLNGLPTLFRPQFWIDFTERNLKDNLSPSVMGIVEEYRRLSDTAIRAIAGAEVAAGLALICLGCQLGRCQEKPGKQ